MKRLFRKAVEDPIHFPPLSRAVFPGDKVVLVPDPFVLAHGRLLETLIDHLIDYGITPSDITVMMTEQERSLAEKNDHLQTLITKKEKKGVVFHSFLPYKPDSCSILCNRSDGEPIALARPLVDADVVIPVERHYQTPPFGHYGTLSALAPRFCDLQTQIHFTAGDRPEKREKIVEEFAAEIRETARQLGVAMVIEVTSSDGKEIDGVFFGDPEAVDRHLKDRNNPTMNN